MRLFSLLAITFALTTAAHAESAVDDASAAPPADVISGVEGPIVGGDHTRFETARGAVHVWKPYGYVRETAITIVFVHGYWLDVDDAWLDHGLPEQFGAAGVNALFVACEAPVDRWDPVKWTSVDQLLTTVEFELGEPVPGKVAAVGHSGAFRTLAEWVTDPRLDTLVMLAAGYGDLKPFHRWIRGSPSHRLISVGSDTLSWTTRLHRFLPGTRTVDEVGQLGDPAIRRARLIHVRSEEVGHMQVITDGTSLPAILRALGAPLVTPTILY
jgi:hypothetical protein